jgi:hypothetical protein
MASQLAGRTEAFPRNKVFSASGHMSIPEQQDLSKNLKGSEQKTSRAKYKPW